MKKKLVLFVDDEKDLLKLIETRLMSWGYDVITAPDGEKGLQLLRERKPDLVLLDYLLPGMDGATVCKQIKNDNELKKTPLIFFSASPHLLSLEVLHSTKADDYIVKPFDPTELHEKIKHFIG